jgi:hypothetical protein
MTLLDLEWTASSKARESRKTVQRATVGNRERGDRFEHVATTAAICHVKSRSMKRVPVTGCSLYGAISWNPSERYNPCASTMVASVSSRIF